MTLFKMSNKITVGLLRNLLNQLDSEEISFSKMAEILNETNKDIRIENDSLNFVIKQQTEEIRKLREELKEANDYNKKLWDECQDWRLKDMPKTVS